MCGLRASLTEEAPSESISGPIMQMWPRNRHWVIASGNQKTASIGPPTPDKLLDPSGVWNISDTFSMRASVVMVGRSV